MPRRVRKISAYWWPEVANFGDKLSPLLIKHFTDLDSEWSPPGVADIVSTGSVLEHVPPYFEGVILGTGKLYPDSRLSLHTGTAEILALRGPYSAAGVPGSYVLGDPGLLADELVSVEAKKYDLGIVPHWSDTELAFNPAFTPFNPVIISPRADPLEVVRTIGECRKIVTSSLHGAIVSDAFGIPRRLELPPSKFAREGGTFKLEDYHASLAMKLEFGKTAEAPRDRVEDMRNDLMDTFDSLKTLMGTR